MKGFKKIKKVLITGSTGFLGSELVKLLQKKYIVYGNSRTAVKKNNFKADLVNINDVEKIKENLISDPETLNFRTWVPQASHERKNEKK